MGVTEGAAPRRRAAAAGRLVGATLACALNVLTAGAAVLPEDRADMMYHRYDGGGTKVDGPALLVRKGIGDSASVYASYYADNISGASIDVETTASPYKEKRTEYGVGVDFLRRNTAMNLAYTTSDEPDYRANTLGLTLSHEMFDGLTTVNLGYAVGRDDVGKVDTDFDQNIDRYQYRLGLSQVLSKTLVVSLEYEATLEDGYLNSPYRAARVQGLLVPERYPGTRDSYAVALRAVKGLQVEDDKLGASVRLGYRYFWDTWDVRAHTVELAYQRYVGGRWLGELRYRYYDQSAASFYSDDFTVPQNYMARDKELSTFKSHSLGVKASYRLFEQQRFGLDRASLTLSYDRMRFNYDDFTDVRNGEAYSFDADVVQLLLSAWY